MTQMKKVLFIGCVIAFAASCSPRLYNVTKSYDKSHFEQLQRIIDNPVTPKEAAFFYTEASELGLIGNMFSDIKVPYHRIDTVRYKGMTKQERYQATCSLFSAMGHPFQQFAEMISRSSATSGCSLVWRSTDLRLLSYGLT